MRGGCDPKNPGNSHAGRRRRKPTRAPSVWKAHDTTPTWVSHSPPTKNRRELPQTLTNHLPSGSRFRYLIMRCRRVPHEGQWGLASPGGQKHGRADRKGGARQQAGVGHRAPTRVRGRGIRPETPGAQGRRFCHLETARTCSRGHRGTNTKGHGDERDAVKSPPSSLRTRHRENAKAAAGGQLAFATPDADEAPALGHASNPPASQRRPGPGGDRFERILHKRLQIAPCEHARVLSSSSEKHESKPCSGARRARRGERGRQRSRETARKRLSCPDSRGDTAKAWTSVLRPARHLPPRKRPSPGRRAKQLWDTHTVEQHGSHHGILQKQQNGKQRAHSAQHACSGGARPKAPR